MFELAAAEAWIGLVGGALALAAAALGLGNAVLQARRQSPAPAEPPARLASPERSARDDEPKRVLLLGRAPFVNREAELKDLIARIHTGRENVLAVEGDHWVGKSATVTELAHCLLTDRAEGRFDPRDHTFLRIDAGDRCPSLTDICRELSLLTDDQSLSAVAEEEKRHRR